MKTIRQLLSAVTLTLVASNYAFAGPIYTYGGHDYTVVDNGTWTEAEADAVALGGHLVTINDAAEEAWLQQIFGTSLFWIGLNDYDVEGTFVWSSGEAVTYTNWNVGEPNDWNSGNPGEDFAVMNWDSAGWNDLPSDFTAMGIAEIFEVPEITPVPEISPVPEPGTLALLGLGLAGMGMTRRKKKV